MELTWHVAPGVVFSKFHHRLAEGKIAATRCARCGAVYLPPRLVCGDCYEPLSEWVHVADSGTIEAFTISHYPMLDAVTGKSRPTPYASLLIKLDGASTSLNHYLVGADPQAAGIGKRVKAVWGEPRTTLKDLVGFRLTDGAADDSFPRPLKTHPIAVGADRIKVHLKMPFSYAAGKAGRWFFVGMRKGEILGSRCETCARTRVPCRSFCEQCFRPLGEHELRRVGPAGVLKARAGRVENALGLIQLDGSDNHFLHFTSGAEPGSRVTARFKPADQRRGHPLDIECFEPMGDLP